MKSRERLLRESFKLTIMKLIFCIAVFFALITEAFSQNDAGLNGREFKCRFTEITPPDVDRMPKYFEETVYFEDGKLSFGFLKRYDSGSVPFSAEIDERRMVAFTVVNFSSSGDGKAGDFPVSITFDGSVLGYVGLSGELRITGSYGTERFIVESLTP